MFSVFQVSSGELSYTKELSETVKDAYFLGAQSKGGGAIGAVGAVPLEKLLGQVGAVIFCIGIAGVLIVFTFGINLSEWITNLLEKAEERKYLIKKNERKKRSSIRRKARRKGKL